MPDVQWRNREKRYDKEHHEMVSFFHLAEFENDTFLSSPLPMYLVMLFVLVEKRSNYNIKTSSSSHKY